MTLASNTYFYYLCLSIEGDNSLQTIVASSVPIILWEPKFRSIDDTYK